MVFIYSEIFKNDLWLLLQTRKWQQLFYKSGIEQILVSLTCVKCVKRASDDERKVYFHYFIF